MWRSSIVVKFFLKNLTFSQVLSKYSRTLTERSTPFSDTYRTFTAISCKIIIIFLGRNGTNNKFLDVTNKEINKVMRHRCWTPSLLTSFLREFIFSWRALPSKTSPEKSDDKNWRKFYAVLFLFYFGPSFLCANVESMLTYLNSSLEAIHMIIFMKSTITFFFHSFHIVTLVCEQGKSKNKM